ncbi:MAG: endopeptidase La [Candidatus Poribacteria bacterium]|nr:endopeptidase La [Candidatus Poribacteria bacterium]
MENQSSTELENLEKDEDAEENLETVELPILPVDDLVIFPYMPPVPPFPPHHVALSGKMVMDAVDDAMLNGERVLCIFQTTSGRSLDTDPRAVKDMTLDELRPIGSLIHILRAKKDDEDVLFLANGRARVEIEEILHTEPYLKARVRLLQDEEDIEEEEMVRDDEETVEGDEDDLELEALVRSTDEMFQRIVQLSSRYQEEHGLMTKSIDEPGRLADYIAAVLDLKPQEKQQILETIPIVERLNKLTHILAKEVDLHELESKIQSNAQAVINKGQREYFLREQLKAIQTELGEADDLASDIEEMRAQLKKAKLPQKAKKAANKELNRLSKMQSFSPESTVSRNYLDWLLNLPWAVSTKDSIDLTKAMDILDEDHYNLVKVKERIVEHLAVRILRSEMKGPIFCFVGPPGVGKTSLGKSIARSIGRKFVRLSLGGMHDEAEIRGHRRTYIGSMPGRIVKGIRQAESNNPVFMLDEIDKLGSDFRGDPAAALLEVLDPEQNHSFTDNYLDVPFDLSQIMFITTANQIHSIPPPLRDRMETIELPGYTSNEKKQIAKQYLLPRQLLENGITKKQLGISDAAIQKVVKEYTREAGVRNLERELGKLCRKSARRVAEGETDRNKIGVKDIPNYLGPPKFDSEIAGRTADIGVATGLSVTPAGGEILFIEATSSEKQAGKGELLITGQIGNVMHESAQTALTYIKSQSTSLKFDVDALQDDIHIHVPAGAIPKDGPSAGITIAAALASIATKKGISPEVAMTGELTLRGRVLPIGGVKEKILAAKQAGIKKIIVPQGNQKDFVEIPEDIQEGLAFHFVENMNQVFSEVFDK